MTKIVRDFALQIELGGGCCNGSVGIRVTVDELGKVTVEPNYGCNEHPDHHFDKGHGAEITACTPIRPT